MFVETVIAASGGATALMIANGSAVWLEGAKCH